jgi:hypothetical protein
MKAKRKTGRRRCFLSIELPPEEMTILERLAGELGVKPGEWLRRRALGGAWGIDPAPAEPLEGRAGHGN